MCKIKEKEFYQVHADNTTFSHVYLKHNQALVLVLQRNSKEEVIIFPFYIPAASPKITIDISVANRKNLSINHIACKYYFVKLY